MSENVEEVAIWKAASAVMRALHTKLAYQIDLTRGIEFLR